VGSNREQQGTKQDGEAMHEISPGVTRVIGV